MKHFQVTLNSIDSVKQFVNVSSTQSFDIDVTSGRYVVDGKSILALFSINLNQPVEVICHGTEEEAERFFHALKEVLDV